MILILLLVVFILLLILSGICFVRDKKRIGAPGPYPLPILGNALYLGGNSSKLMETLKNVTDTFGDVVLFFAFSTRYVLLRHPNDFEDVISSTKHITKGESYQYLRPWLGQGLLTSSGNPQVIIFCSGNLQIIILTDKSESRLINFLRMDKLVIHLVTINAHVAEIGHRWKSHRKLLTPAFHFNVLQTFLLFFLKNQKALIAKLGKAADGRTFDLFPIIALVALDNVTESAMGVSVNAQSNSESEYVKAIAEISEIIMMRMFNPALVFCKSLFNVLPSKAKHDKALRILHSQTNKVIQTRHQWLNDSQNCTVESEHNMELGIKKKSSFLDLLLQSQVNGKNLDMESIREEVDTFMFEGHDTTTSAICFCLYSISNKQDVQDKLLEEQRSLFAEDFYRDATYTDLYQMKYLELVIKETLRLYPSVPLISRLITSDSKIAGFEIPKDTTVLIDIFHTQRDARFFDNPNEFRPERFLETNSQSSSSPFRWIPFSAGPRNCIGQKFAMMEMKVVVSSIIKHFQVLPSGIEPILCSDLILRSKNGVNIKLLPRT